MSEARQEEEVAVKWWDVMGAQLIQNVVPLWDEISHYRSYACCMSPVPFLGFSVIIKILSRIKRLDTGVELVIGSVGLWKLVTARNCKGSMDLHS
jgi:hypothetical protein